MRVESYSVYPLRLPMDWGYDVYEVLEPGKESEVHYAFVHGGTKGHGWVGVDAMKLVFHGSCEYRDATGGTFYIDGFCFRMKFDAKGMTLEGGEQYNYKSEVRPAAVIERP